MAEVSAEEWVLWRKFHTMGRKLGRALEEQLQHDAGISDPDYAVLLALTGTAERQLRSRDLVEQMGWEKSRLSHQVTRMVSRGLVERLGCDDDQRGTWIRVTPSGRRAMLKATRGHANAIRRLFFDLLSDEELSALASASDRVIDALEPPTSARPL